MRRTRIEASAMHSWLSRRSVEYGQLRRARSGDWQGRRDRFGARLRSRLRTHVVRLRRAHHQIFKYIEDNALSIDWLIETHAHADHLSAAPFLQKRIGGALAIGHAIGEVQETFGKLFNAGTEFERDGSQFDRLFDDGDAFDLGRLNGIALHVPGHTPADMAFVIGDAAFVGDTIFMPDFGTARADFPGGDAGQLYRSIRRLLSLPQGTRLFLCHDYKAQGRDVFAWETTVGSQRRGNIHVSDGVSEEEFVAMRTARDRRLAVPKLIFPSVQVNMRGGHLPAPDTNGVSYIRIPVNAI
jgi:glyoxylase-like metal-dependent hydrolase (beta-lactamase superfamily II)